MVPLTAEQTGKLEKNDIKIVEKAIVKVEHIDGYVQNIVFSDSTIFPVKAIYAPRPFLLHCSIPTSLRCQLTEDGYLKVDVFNEITVAGIFACGDNATTMRIVANAVAVGTDTDMIVSKKMILGEF